MTKPFFQIAILFEVQAGGEIFIDNLGAIRAFKTATFRCCKNATKIKSSKPFKRLWFEHLLFVCCRNATSNISFQVRAAWMKFSFLKARILPAASAAAFWSTTTAKPAFTKPTKFVLIQRAEEVSEVRSTQEIQSLVFSEALWIISTLQVTLLRGLNIISFFLWCGKAWVS